MANWMCPRRIGFLFPHPCDRLTPIGCPECDNGQIADPYASSERAGYDNYDEADYSDWPDVSAAGYGGAPGDFTEADGESLVKPEEDFEDDPTAS